MAQIHFLDGEGFRFFPVLSKNPLTTHRILHLDCAVNQKMINFASEMQIDRERETLARWVEQRLYRGFYTFTYHDVEKEFPSWDNSYMSTALNRIIRQNKIISPTRGFYVLIPVEYALSGLVPATFYVDQMMSYLERDYYVGLLNAAGFYGAAHQRPQTFTVINNGASIRDGVRAGISFVFINNSHIDSRFIRKHKTKLGSINVSSPELTAIDLIENQSKVGGLNRVCTVMNELVDCLDFSNVDDAFFKIYGIPIYQRMGYILDDILEESELAEILFDRLKALNVTFRKTAFKAGKETAGCEVDEKWKIIINQEIDIDE